MQQFSLEIVLGCALAFISKLAIEKFLHISLPGWKGFLFVLIVSVILTPILINLEDNRRHRAILREIEEQKVSKQQGEKSI